MKKIFFCFVYSVFLLLITAIGFAANNEKEVQKNDTANAQIILYVNPDATSMVVKKLSPDVRLIPFYRVKDWVKVGSPKDGQVGWVNLPQYNQAREAFYRPNVQTVFIQMDKSNDRGKPTVNLIAYKNGEKLTDKEAEDLYKKLQEENAQQYRNYWKNIDLLNQQMQDNMLNMQHIFDTSWPVMLPEKPNDSSNQHSQQKK